MRLIDLDKADVEQVSCSYSDHTTLEDVKDWLDGLPTISHDRLVKLGQWVKDSSGLYSCSECGKTAPYREIEGAIEYWPELRHCHYCGALMIGDVEWTN